MAETSPGSDTSLNGAMEKARQQYNERYAGQAYYWSTSPSSICVEILKHMPPTKRCRVLELHEILSRGF